jgi:FkbM family methyltransferase
MIKKIISNLVKNAGYVFYKKEFMPFGINLALDILRFDKGLNKIQTIFDVGANIGQTAFAFRKEFPRATIHSFEPVGATFKKLKENLVQQPGCHCWPFAFGNRPGDIEIPVYDNSEWNSLADRKAFSTPPSGFEKIQVDTIDAFTAREGIERVDILKTDTEGYDVEVLEGAARLLKSAKYMFVCVEVTFQHADKLHTPFHKVEQILNPCGFGFVGLYDSDYSSFSPIRPPLSYCNALFYKNTL